MTTTVLIGADDALGARVRALLASSVTRRPLVLIDDPTSADCGRCRNCTGQGLDETVMLQDVVAASTFLRGETRTIEPRKQWPADAEQGFVGRIVPPNESGISLSIYGDAGWGREVAEGKGHGEPFGDELVAAAVVAIRRQWHPTAEEGWWVAAVPSHRHPGLVGRAAMEIASALGVPCHDVLSIADVAEQRTMQNSSMQFRNVQGALQMLPPLAPGPVLLIDDIVDSRWTLTMAGWLLRSHGSGPVHPFAFADSSGRSDS